MQHFYELGPAPCDEPCASIGQVSEQIAECNRYKELLRAMFPNWERHDCRFGTMVMSPMGDHPYREVVIYYNPDRHDSRNYARFVEQNLPANWYNRATLAAFVQSGNMEHLRAYKYPTDDPTFF